MRFVAAGENAKWTRAFSAFTHDSVNRTHVRIVPVTAVLEIEKRTGANVGFSRKRDAISQRFQVVGNVSNMVKRLSVIWMGTRFHGVLTGVDVVSSGRTHRGTLEAVSHSHPLGCRPDKCGTSPFLSCRLAHDFAPIIDRIGATDPSSQSPNFNEFVRG